MAPGSGQSSRSGVEQLEELLGESVAHAREREAHALDAAIGAVTPVVVFGAGGLGRKIARVLGDHGRSPLAFADNNAQLWGRQVDGISVLSPSEAAQRWGDTAAFLLAIWHPRSRSAVLEVQSQLRGLGVRQTVPFPLVFWKYPERLLPYFFWELPSKLLAEADAMRTTFSLFEDETSRTTFLSQLRLRLRADFDGLPAPSDGLQYFPDGLFSALENEYFIDCGAYDGDSVRDFLRRTGGRFGRIAAFEPDPANFVRLRQMVEDSTELRGRTRVFPLAVDRESGVVRFAATGGANAAITETGEVVVECKPLDEVLAGEEPSFVKMDIEGAERGALHGASRLIRQHHPVLAICAYHRPDDLWEIPRLLSEMEPDSRLTLRPHCADGLDLVCYAVPPARWLKGVDRN